MTDEHTRPQRRVRYKGTHPRHSRRSTRNCRRAGHADELEKVASPGHTPAGTHRSICVAEILAVLDPKAGEVALDATLGYGGHTRELLPHLLPGGRLFGVDVDPLELPRTEARLRSLGFGEDAAHRAPHELRGAAAPEGGVRRLRLDPGRISASPPCRSTIRPGASPRRPKAPWTCASTPGAGPPRTC